MNQTTDLSNIPEEIMQRVNAYQRAEMIWMDAHVRAQWPGWICYLAEKNSIWSHLLRVVVAKFSGLEVVRNRNFVIGASSGNGFRPGKAPSQKTIESITTTIFKHRRGCREVKLPNNQRGRPLCSDACVVGKEKFALNIPAN